MSRELAYFPPRTTRWQWSPKALQHSPWVCNLAPQMGAGHWKLSVYLTVDLIDGRYVWRVQTRDWDGELSEQTGSEDTAKKATAAAERIGEDSYRELTPEWVTTALQNGWRPPWKAVKR